MISCSVCNTENDDFAVVCTSCHSFLQAKVDHLDLFSTLWGLAESPSATFRRIVLARYKTYVVPLAMLAGCMVTFVAFWHWTIARRLPLLSSILGAGFAAGPFVGLLLLLLFAIVMKLVGKAMGGKGTIRNLFAVATYALSPLVIALFALFPIEIGRFGVYLFDTNPPPYVIYPVPYVLLVGLNALLVVWSTVLLVLGTRVVQGLSLVRSCVVVLVIAGVLGGLLYGIRIG
jgi:hypothetical protein